MIKKPFLNKKNVFGCDIDDSLYVHLNELGVGERDDR